LEADVNTSLENLDEWTNRHRPTALLLTVTLTIGIAVLVNWAIGSNLFQQLFYPERESVADVRFWSALVYATAFGLGLPVAFLLWHWRDRNVRDQIENDRKDTNLKEFQDVQVRAAGGFDKEFSSEVKATLQIAALHQLRGFLKGGFGPAFRRPALETYSALLSRYDASQWENGDEASNLIPNEIFDALRSIVFEEWQWFFWEDYKKRISWPLAGRSFHAIKLPPGADLQGIDLSGVSFYGSALDLVSFNRSDCSDTNFGLCSLRNSRFDGAVCDGAKFDDADLAGASSVCADFSSASFNRTKFHAGDFTRASFFRSKGRECEFVNTTLTDANFNDCRFVKVDFQNSRLQGAKFVSAHITSGSIAGADVRNCDFSYAMLDGFYPFQAQLCEGAVINDKTWLPHPDAARTSELLSTERKAILLLWREHGAKLVDINLEADVPDSVAKDEAVVEKRGRLEALRLEAFKGILDKRS
jgi:Pentapeptide repeats (9 copies)/Pentapeptide repeats (8 copies)